MSDLETKVALLMDRESSNFEDVMHKLRNIEQSNNYMYSEMKQIKSNIRTFLYGAAMAFTAVQSGVIEFIKQSMQ